MDDVVGQGSDDPPRRPLRRRTAVGAVVLVALAGGAVLVNGPNPLSADPPRSLPTPAPSISTLGVAGRGENTSQGVSIVVRRGDRLERYEAGSGVRPLADLPDGFRVDAPLVHVERLDGAGPLLGVDGTVLFRASAQRRGRSRTVTSIARARRVVSPSATPGRVIVEQPFGGPGNRPRLVELDARTGAVTDAEPYPGYDPSGPWRAVGLVDLLSRSALLLTRPALDGRTELGLAWDPLAIRLGRPPVVPIGTTGALLSVNEDRIVSLDSRLQCSGGPCPVTGSLAGRPVTGRPVTVRTVTRDGLLSRPVDPPPGWAFGTTAVSGDDGDPLVEVTRAGEPDRRALARLAAGGRQALLIAGSEGFAADVAPAGGPDGSVVFAVPRPEGTRLAVWRPGARAAALLVDLPALQEGARLVCACR